MTFTAPAIVRATAPTSGDERVMLDGFLDSHRDTLLHKCAGLDTAGLLSAPVASSSLRLIGLVRHLTDVEYYLFGEVLNGATGLSYYGSEDDPRVDFREAAGADPAEAFDRYRAAVAYAREAAAAHALDHVFLRGTERFTVRWIYLHLIEEYARHNGHADILREAVDGVTGE